MNHQKKFPTLFLFVLIFLLLNLIGLYLVVIHFGIESIADFFLFTAIIFSAGASAY